MLPDGSMMIVKEHFDYSANLDRCLVQTRQKDALSIAIEDESRK